MCYMIAALQLLLFISEEAISALRELNPNNSIAEELLQLYVNTTKSSMSTLDR